MGKTQQGCRPVRTGHKLRWAAGSQENADNTDGQGPHHAGLANVSHRLYLRTR